MLRTVLQAVLVVLLEVHVVLELRRIMHIVWVFPLPRLPLCSLVGQLCAVLRLVSLCDRFELVVPVLRLLHVVRQRNQLPVDPDRRYPVHGGRGVVVHVLQTLLFAVLFAVLHVLLVLLRRLLPAVGRRRMLRGRRHRHERFDGCVSGAPRRGGRPGGPRSLLVEEGAARRRRQCAFLRFLELVFVLDETRRVLQGDYTCKEGGKEGGGSNLC